MGVSTFQLLKMVAPVILFTLILGSLDVWTDANIIGYLFTGAAECLRAANRDLCKQVGAAVFCKSSEYNSSKFDHSVCYGDGQGCILHGDGDYGRPGQHWFNCVKDSEAYCNAPDTKHNVVCGHKSHPIFGAMIAGI